MYQLIVKNDITKYKRKLEISDRELAKMTGLSKSTISDVETGKHYPSILTALMLARALNVSVDMLFWLEEKNE